MLPPSEFKVHGEVPNADEENSDEIGHIDVEVKEPHLNVQQYDAENDSRHTDDIEFGEPPRPSHPASRSTREITKSPDLVPEKVVENGYFGSDGFAQRESPAQQPGISQKEQDGHVHTHTARAHEAEADE